MSSHNPTSREVLPIPDRKPVGLTTYNAEDPDTKFPPITPLRPPTGAPNVLVILLDNVGFGASSAFGAPCHAPVRQFWSATTQDDQNGVFMDVPGRVALASIDLGVLKNADGAVDVYFGPKAAGLRGELGADRAR